MIANFVEAVDLVLEVTAAQPGVEVVARVIRYDRARPRLHRLGRRRTERRRIGVVERVDSVVGREWLEIVDPAEIRGYESDALAPGPSQAEWIPLHRRASPVRRQHVSWMNGGRPALVDYGISTTFPKFSLACSRSCA